MESSERNHIYRYDRERKKMVVIDSETGEEISRNDGTLTRLLTHLHGQDGHRALRKFAIWCARQPNLEWKPVVYNMFRTAEDYLHGDVSNEGLKQLYQETEGMAVSTDSVGLQQGDTKAPLLLAARACLNPDPYRAACEASRYHKLWAEMEFKSKNNDLSTEDEEEVIQHLMEQVTKRQIDCVLDLLADENNISK